MKKTIIILLALTLVLTSFACAKQEAEPTEPVRVAALAGPTGMGLAYMMQDMQDNYQVEIFTAPDQVTAKVIKGNINSFKVLNHLGFVREGVMRASLLKNGRYFDLVVFSLLNNEYHN